MPKNLLRFVAILLIPAMVAQSIASPALTGTLGERAGVRQPSLFVSQALASEAEGFTNPRIEGRTRTRFGWAGVATSLGLTLFGLLAPTPSTAQEVGTRRAAPPIHLPQPKIVAFQDQSGLFHVLPEYGAQILPQLPAGARLMPAFEGTLTQVVMQSNSFATQAYADLLPAFSPRITPIMLATSTPSNKFFRMT